MRAAPWSARAQDLSGQLYASVDDDAKKKLDELFEELESATPTKTVLGLMHQLRDVRLGEQPIDGLDLTSTPTEPTPDGEKPPTGGATTNGRRSSRSGGGKVLTAQFSAE